MSNRFTAALEQLKQEQLKQDALGQAEKAKAATSIDSINTDIAALDKKIDAYNKKYGSDTMFDAAKNDAQKHKKELEQEAKDREEVLSTNTEIKKEAEKIQHEVEKNKEIQKQFDGLNGTLNDSADVFNQLTNSLSGEVSPSDMAKAADTISKGYDKVLKNTVKTITGNDSTTFIEAWAKNKFDDKLYDAASAIKNGAGTAISGIDGLMGLGDTFSGSWRDPKTSAEKIARGIAQIQTAVTGISQVANNIFIATTRNKNGSVILGKLDLKENVGVNAMGKLAGTTALGIGSVSAFRSGDISGGLKGIGATVGGLKETFSGIKESQIGKQKEELETKIKQEIEKKYGIGDFPQSDTRIALAQGQITGAAAPEDGSLLATDDDGAAAKGNVSATSTDDDYGADMINEVYIILDGVSTPDISCCTINGIKYKCSGYTLSQELLQPMMLSFSIEKENKEETQQDVIFADATQVIGKTLEMKATTIKTSQGKGSPRNAFTFKGMVIDVSASRATASAQSATITAATWDSLLQNAPHCRSFEKKTLKEIIGKVLEPYSEIASSINPRYTGKIPYIVQYNQSDYSFIRMLAARFGEWMYNTGDKLIFGDMESIGGTADLEYPGGSLMSYHLSQDMAAFSFSHLLPDHYKYGYSGAIVKTNGSNVADGNVNDWTDKAYQASQHRYAQEHITALPNGGFDDWESEEGAETIMDYSLNIEAHGMKAGLMTVGGDSKLAMLKIGQPFMICDNVQNKSGENMDVQQKVLKIIGIHHSFDYRQEYSNTFTAIPMACKYPSYSDSSLHATAPTQRAKVVDNKDEKKLGRIRVQFPWQEKLDPQMKTPWLRIAVPYAGKDKGHLFIPEIDEEVIVGFEMDNAERPYIIGALYNGGKGKPDEKWAAINNENDIKAIRTRNGHTILINDRGDAGVLEIYDNKNKTYHITLSADDKKITIYSAGDIEINADGSITMNAKNNVSVNANKEVSIQALNVKVR